MLLKSAYVGYDKDYRERERERKRWLLVYDVMLFWLLVFDAHNFDAHKAICSTKLCYGIYWKHDLGKDSIYDVTPFFHRPFLFIIMVIFICKTRGAT